MPQPERGVPAGRAWHRWLAALALGAVATLALPPVDAAPALAVAFSGLLLLSRGVMAKRAAFALGWWFGFGHFASNLYWIANAFTVDGDRFLWMIPFAALALPAVVAVYAGLVMAVLAALRLDGVARALAFALLWTAAEWLRGHLFTGFPWNIAASAWTAWPEMLQTASLIGAWGLTLVTVLLAALPSAWRAPFGRPAIAAGLAILAAGWGFGHWRLAGASDATVPGVQLRLVQASVPQQLKWQEGQREATFRRHMELSTLPAAVPPTMIVWPETAVPFFVEWEPQVVAEIAAIAPEGGALVTGTVRMRRPPGERPVISNGLVAIDRAGSVAAFYDKSHLVPFGEYVPFRSLLSFLPLLPGEVDFTPGPGLRTIRIPGAPPAGPLICYEVIFPGRVTDRDDRPHWLLNLTNDAWYGRSAGPYQHFAMTRMRAVEEGLPAVRSAQNGISGVIDPYGRVIRSLDLDAVGVVDAPLPQALPPTPYARWREAPAGLLALALLLVTFRLRTRASSSRVDP